MTGIPQKLAVRLYLTETCTLALAFPFAFPALAGTEVMNVFGLQG